jgi:hypothetical protein
MSERQERAKCTVTVGCSEYTAVWTVLVLNLLEKALCLLCARQADSTHHATPSQGWTQTKLHKQIAKPNSEDEETKCCQHNRILSISKLHDEAPKLALLRQRYSSHVATISPCTLAILFADEPLSAAGRRLSPPPNATWQWTVSYCLI